MTPNPTQDVTPTRRPLMYALVFASGMAGLTWELLWQHYAALAVGVSAMGTAIVLAATMAGLAVGSVFCGRMLERKPVERPLRLYALLELIIGIHGALIPWLFLQLEAVDSWAYQISPQTAVITQLTGMVLILAVPTIAMGATIPLFVQLARQFNARVSVLYALNTGGAALGVLGATFLLLPTLGFSLTGKAAAAINLLVAAIGMLVAQRQSADSTDQPTAQTAYSLSLNQARALVFVTGFVTFTLEVSWFRSLRAAFQSTTEVFAILLFSVLLPLAVGARLAPVLRHRGTVSLPWLVAGAGALVLLVTPLIERFDMVPFLTYASSFYALSLTQLGLVLVVIAWPVTLLGIALPWLLEEHCEPAEAGRLYGLNTAGAVVGALLSAWVLLPGLGAVAVAWVAGGLLGVVALWLAPSRTRATLAGMVAVCLAVAVWQQSGVGRLRVQTAHTTKGHQVIDSMEGPDSTVSVIELNNGVRELVIDGFMTAGEGNLSHYMVWMGRLPMLMHPAPEKALVICFGTGQTANALRNEGAGQLDIVELSPAVIAQAPNFPSNQNVVNDPNVRVIQMDGRAWLRRTTQRYDVITLEPMAPSFAGANALYSHEFYQAADRALAPGGVMAQWLPIHLLTPTNAASVVATMRAVFPNTWVWVDPIDGTGIVLSRKGNDYTGDMWPGLARAVAGRDLSASDISRGLVLDPAGSKRYERFGVMITDDNEYLSYGEGRFQRFKFPGAKGLSDFNQELLGKVRNEGERPPSSN